MQGLLDTFNKWWNVLHTSTSGIVLRYSTDDPTIASITSDGYARVVSWKNGQQQVYSWNGGELTNLDVSADDNTDIVIYGRITDIVVGNNSTFINTRGDRFLKTLNCSGSQITELDLRSNTALTLLNCSYCSALQSLDLSNNTALKSMLCSVCTSIQSLDFSNNTALKFLICNSCDALQSLDFSNNTALTTLNCFSCYNIVTIGYNAVNTSVASTLAAAVTAATSSTGTFHLKHAAQYNSVIENACTNKGWSVIYDL